MQSFGLLLLLLAGAHAAQFSVTRPNLSIRRRVSCSAAWGNLVLFAGVGKVVDIFENGVRTGGANLTMVNRDCETASASPGVIAIAEFIFVEFFDVATRAFLPYNTSLRLTNAVRSGVGSLTSDVLAFAVNGGTVDVLSSTSQRVLGSFSLGCNGAYATRVLAIGGQEFFLFAGGIRISDSVAVADVTVLPVSSPLVPVSPVSQLAHARSAPTCATTSLNVVVCVGGRDATGTTVTEADICTIDAAGVLSCTSRTYATAASVRVPVPLGPFVAFMPRRLPGEDLTVSDTTTMQEIEIESLSWPSGFASAGAGRFAYIAGGSVGSQYFSNVTVVECLAPCQLPLQVSSSTITGATAVGTGTTSASSQGSGGTALTVSIGVIVAALMLTHLLDMIWTIVVFLVAAAVVFGMVRKMSSGDLEVKDAVYVASGGADAKKVE